MQKKMPKKGLRKTIKIRLEEKAAQRILSKETFLSKKDIGYFVSDLIMNTDLKEPLRNYVHKKYSLDDVTSVLKTSKRKILTFTEVCKKAKLSNKTFYQKLKIMKKHFSKKPLFGYTIKRGKFVKL